MVMLAATEEVGTTMSEALVNTALGMGTVFVVLILISFIIYLLKFIPDLLNKPKKVEISAEERKQAEKPLPPPQLAADPVSETVAEQDDTQLVAVITAAIAAAMEQEGTPVPPDGLVIRSIKKRF